MVKPAIGLAGLRGCSKPNCRLRAPLNRHHRRHEAIWLSAWAHRRGEPKYREMVARYWEFRSEDIVVICLNHHAEIHMTYDTIIAEDMAKTGLPLYLYSWRQAKILMDKLDTACALWLLAETPGVDSRIYE